MNFILFFIDLHPKISKIHLKVSENHPKKVKPLKNFLHSTIISLTFRKREVDHIDIYG